MQLPVKQLQNEEADNLGKVNALQTLNSSVAALASSISALGSLGANQGLNTSSSNTGLVTVTNTGATSTTAYTISNIQSLASAASETSVKGYADDTTALVSALGNMQLVVGGQTFSIALSPSQNNLTGLSEAINALNAGVTASILTTGTGSTPDYLTLSATGTGATTLQLNDIASGGGSTDLITQANQGSNAIFELNGIPITKSSNTVNDVIPGMSFNLLGTTTGSQSATLSASPDSSQLNSALTDLVTNYNALVDEVNTQVGGSGGALNGDTLIAQTSDDMRQLAMYNGSGGMNLTTLGITFDTTGKMTFDPTAVGSLSGSQLTQAFQFLGSATTGLGGFASQFTQLSDPVNGLITTEENTLNQENTSLSGQISTLTTRITTMQTALTQQLEAADSAIAALQSQQQVLTASIQAVDYTVYGKDFGQTTTGG